MSFEKYKSQSHQKNIFEDFRSLPAQVKHSSITIILQTHILYVQIAFFFILAKKIV